MKKTFLTCLFAFLCVSILLSQTEEKHAKFQFTFFPPVGTQGTFSKDYTNDFSLNLLVGRSYSERKFTLAGLANIIKQDATGLQIAGLTNIIGADAAGFQIAGLTNIIGADAAGFQIAGLSNIIGTDAAGFQIAGLTNIIGGDAAGFQIAGLGNIVGGDAAGFQIAGLFNKTQDVAGIQLAGLVNIANDVSGIQLAGLINIANHSDYPVGLINIIKDGEMSVGLTYNEIGSTVLSFRSGGRVLYGIVGAGYNWRSVSDHDWKFVEDHRFVLQVGLGAHIRSSSVFQTNIEATASNLSVLDENETAQYTFGIFPALKLTRHLEIFVGPTFNFLQTDELANKDLFPGVCINIWKDFGDSKLKQAYIGISGGIQYVF